MQVKITRYGQGNFALTILTGYRTGHYVSTGERNQTRVFPTVEAASEWATETGYEVVVPGGPQFYAQNEVQLTHDRDVGCGDLVFSLKGGSEGPRGRVVETSINDMVGTVVLVEFKIGGESVPVWIKSYDLEHCA